MSSACGGMDGVLPFPLIQETWWPSEYLGKQDAARVVFCT